MDLPRNDGLPTVQDSGFTTTHWSSVFSAGQKDSPKAEAARARLCQRYWFPLYAYVRRVGHSHEDAQDLVQGFFARLLEKNYLRTADPNKGRFRSFLLIVLKGYMSNEWDRTQRQKRGGGVQILSLDTADAESGYLAEPMDEMTPEKAYDRRWATLLLGRVLDRLEREYLAAGKTRILNELKVFLTGEKSESTYSEIGQRIGMSEANLKVTVHRFRHRYRELLRMEVAETVAEPEAIDEELRHLLATFS